MGWRVGDLPEGVVACMGEADRKALGLPPRGDGGRGCHRNPTEGAGTAGGAEAGKRGACARPGPNKTEARYREERLRGLVALYEGLTFRFGNGHRYTPDWVVWTGERWECHEVKGAYKLGSHGRARLAFDQARAEFPGFRWVWAEWTGRKWEVGCGNSEVGSANRELRSGDDETSMGMDGQDRAAERGRG